MQQKLRIASEDCFGDCAIAFDKEFDQLSKEDIERQTEAFQKVHARKDECQNGCHSEINPCLMECDKLYGH